MAVPLSRKVALSRPVGNPSSNLQKKVPNQPPEHLLYKWIVLRGVIWHLIFENLSQNENLSEIKLPLVVAIHAEKIRDLI